MGLQKGDPHLPYQELSILWGRDGVWALPSPWTISSSSRMQALARGLEELLARGPL